ncbi:hypothetical protein HPP92_015600 [Vanilla planifolia]|uniref:Zinc knuckle CX2CX4HX4C domain-containing protein n=1 Tax=Vanilla planifolia TaxID=51239 RepID=A0A835UPP7_VANPL|nr:hypothetical protein HPP92_015600 [Vanilla planifolia]
MASYAWVCIKMVLTKLLKFEMWLDGPLGRTFQRFEFEGLPTMFFECGKVGHATGSCIVQREMERNLGEEVGKEQTPSKEITRKNQANAFNLPQKVSTTTVENETWLRAWM